MYSDITPITSLLALLAPYTAAGTTKRRKAANLAANRSPQDVGLRQVRRPATLHTIGSGTTVVA